MIATKAYSVDEYIAAFPADIQDLLEQMRSVIKKAAPAAEEKISYAMPTYYLHGNLVHFAAFKSHIGFYPIPSGIDAFKEELSEYKSAKGSIQFPLNKPLPLDLVSKIVKFRVDENLKVFRGKSKRTCKEGHVYYKSSDCPICPVCEKARKPANGFLSLLGAPARRALENHSINTLERLSKLTEKEILSFHGLGKTSIPKLRKALAEVGLDFKR